MENASKALIIAGAILLSILLISLGLMVYQQAKDTVGNVNLNQQEIETFNSKFTSYQGEKKAGTQVNALIQAVIASNQAEVDANTFKLITVPGYISVNGNTYSVSKSRVTTGKTYTVEFSYTNGVISSIAITETGTATQT